LVWISGFIMNGITKESLLKDSTLHDDVPYNVGTSRNLPDDIRSRLGSTTVIAWTTLDDAYESDIYQTTCCMTLGPFFVVPCLWPTLILCFPRLCVAQLDKELIIRTTYWILTDQDVKIFRRSYDFGCGWCYSTGDSLESIPLSQITDCGIQEPVEGCYGNCVKSVPIIYIDTANTRTEAAPNIWTEAKEHEAVGYALAGYDWFVAAILHQRNRGRCAALTTMRDPETVERRIEKINHLWERGIMTKEEYEKKRQEIFASI
jgi:hypothetical protein